VYVTNPISSGGSLTINTTDSSSSITVLANAALRFQLSVNINVWPHDTIVIYAPSKWTIPTSLESCTSVDVSGVTNYFVNNSGVTADEHKLQCTPSPSEHAIYIYGIA